MAWSVSSTAFSIDPSIRTAELHCERSPGNASPNVTTDPHPNKGSLSRKVSTSTRREKLGQLRPKCVSITTQPTSLLFKSMEIQRPARSSSRKHHLRLLLAPQSPSTPPHADRVKHPNRPLPRKLEQVLGQLEITIETSSETCLTLRKHSSEEFNLSHAKKERADGANGGGTEGTMIAATPLVRSSAAPLHSTPRLP